MQPILTAVAMIVIVLIAKTAQAEVYKCGTKYQSSPCNAHQADANKLAIKQQTEAQKAHAADRLQQIRAEDDARIQQQQAAIEKQQEINLKIANTIANQQNAEAQARQAKAQEIEVAKPTMVIGVPYSGVIVPPARR
jgi:crotonobetainyl-CoA:carnitine CoA-transferase CaiB-like acyl-CoA transferase